LNLFYLLDRCCEQQKFLSDLRNNKTYSYCDLRQASAHLHSLLKAKSICPGDRIVYFAINSGFFFPLLFACSLSRTVLAPLNPKMHGDELANILKHLNPKVIFYDEEYEDLKGMFKNIDSIPIDGKDMLCLNRVDRVDFSVDLSDEKDCDNQIVLLIHTSGTTSNHKAVGLTHKNLYSMARNFSSFYDFKEGQRFLSMLPLYHMDAIMVTGLACINAKAHVFIGDLYGYVLAKNIWNIVEKNKVQVLGVTPSIMASLNELYPAGPTSNVSSVECVFAGTDYLREDLWNAFEKKFRMPCYQSYGLTETTCAASMTPKGEGKRYDSVGMPVGCEVRIDTTIIPAEGVPVGSGEVLIKGDIVMKEYWGNPKATRDVLSEGWLRTGDLGLIDSDGQLVIVGRLKNIIKCKGQLIFPENIDAVIGRHPDVVETYTVGILDEMLGEKVVTACVVKESMEKRDNQLYDFARKNLSPKDMPDRFVFLRCLPRNDMGKVDLRKLREYVKIQID